MTAIAPPPAAPTLDATPQSHQQMPFSDTQNTQALSLGPDTCLTHDDLVAVATYRVGAADGSEHYFGSLFERSGRHMIIFIRHFLCGMCQDFVTHLSQTMPPSSLPSGTTLTIVGCGRPELICDYATRTKCPYPIYSDPSRSLYDALGMISNLEYGDQKPVYQTRSLATQITKSVWQGLSNLSIVSKAGRPSQLGGEMLIETTDKGESEVKWCHRMKNTRGHAEVEDLQKLIHTV